MKRIDRIAILFVLIFNVVVSQDVPIDPAFFTTKNMRIGISLGGDTSVGIESDNRRQLLVVSPVGQTNGAEINLEKPSTNFSLNIGLDVYSPNSILGFFTEINANFLDYQVGQENGSGIDLISSLNLEIPAYIKFRFGKVNRNGHTWVALGGGYSIVSRSMQNDVVFKGENSFLNNTAYLSGMFGLESIVPFKGSKGEEIFNRDNYRSLLFVKFNYDLNNRVDNTFNLDNSTVLGNLPNASLKFLRISIGLKIIFRVSSLKRITS